MIREKDLTAIVSIFGGIAGLSVPLADKRRRVLDALSHLFEAESWELSESRGRDAMEAKHQLTAFRGTRQLVIRRCRKSPPFTPRERLLFEIVTNRIPWLVEVTPVSETTTIRLAPQMQKVLTLICLGGSRKEIAEALQVKTGTVDGYVRDLYRVYGVRSQTELVRLHAGPQPGHRMES